MVISISSRQRNQKTQTGIYLFCVMILLVSAVGRTSAANGLPESTKFGYGMRIDPWGREIDFALNIAAQSGIDWIGIDFDWQKRWPQASQTLDLSALNKCLTFAAENGLSVLLSITNPPEWARTPQGPDQQMTAGLIMQFVRLYPGTLKAIELFPGANTNQGWGADPNPKAYLELLRSTSQTLSAVPQEIILVAAGLVPVNATNNSSDMHDLEFLKELYKAGAASYMPVISMRFPSLRGEPLAAPWETEENVLRHYELVRNLMLEYEHASGTLWLTGFTLPMVEPVTENTARMISNEALSGLEKSQVQWFSQAYRIMKSQLYIGAAFYACLNPPAASDAHQPEQNCLIQIKSTKVDLHPAYTALSQTIALEESHQAMISLGYEEVAIPFDPQKFHKASTP